jgi:hypothetical protein
MRCNRLVRLAVVIGLALPLIDAVAADRALSPIEGARLKVPVSPLVIRRDATLASWEIKVVQREGLSTRLLCDWQRGQYAPASRDFRFTCGEVAAGRSLAVSVRNGTQGASCPELVTPAPPSGTPTILTVERRTNTTGAVVLQFANCRWSQ